MQAFLAAIIAKVLADPKVQEWIKGLLGQLITQRILPLVPVAAAAAAKAVVTAMPGLSDTFVNIEHVTDSVRDELNTLVPDIDFGIPALDELLDWWRPK